MNFSFKLAAASIPVLLLCAAPVILSCGRVGERSTAMGKSLFPRQAASKPLFASIKPETLRIKDCEGISIRRYSVTAGSSRTVAGYVFEPENKDAVKGPRVIFCHWLGGVQGVDINEREFFAEAVAQARDGSVCVLPVGEFPWMTRPFGNEKDLPMIIDEVENCRIALDILFSRPGPKADKALLIAHDYGAMYGILVAAADTGIGAAVLMTPVPDFATWNVLLTRIPDDGARKRYESMLAPVDPINHVAGLTIPLLFQFSEHDEWLTEESAKRLIASAPAANTTVLWYPTAHNLHKFAKATEDRREWAKKAISAAGW